MGLMPHSSPRRMLSSEYYRREFLGFNQRLGLAELEIKSFVPRLCLPVLLQRVGYRTHARVSMPVLNPATILNAGFDSYRLMERHNDLRAMLDQVTFASDAPSLYLLNTGEAHYRYALPGEAERECPRIHGVHGVFQHLDEVVVGGKLRTPFNQRELRSLRDRQIEAVRYLDGVVEEMFDRLPKNTLVAITSDRGERSGEDGYFGHGPIQHEKVFEVPFVEGQVR